jgi:hypothetical protein
MYALRFTFETLTVNMFVVQCTVLNITQTCCIMTFHTLWFYMLMLIGKWDIHLHIWFYDVSIAFHIWYIVRGSTLILGKWPRHIMFWHLHLTSWCKHCVIVCIHLSWIWGHIFTYGFAMYGLLSIIDTLRFDMFVFSGQLRQRDSNILCFDIWMWVHDAN